MKHLYVFSIYTVLIGINIMLLSFYFHERQNNALPVEKFNKLHLEYNNLKNNYFLQLNDNLSFINPNKKIIDIFGDTLSLKDIMFHKPKLVFSFSTFACSSCVESAIERLENIETGVGCENIILLTNYESVRDLVVFYKRTKLNYPIYRINDEFFNLGVDKIHLPYFFVLKDDFRIQDIYIVDQINLNVTKKYLEIISKKHFSQVIAP